MGNNQAGKVQRSRNGPQGRKNGYPGRSRIRRARSDVGSRRNLRVTKLSTQQTLSQRNLKNKDVSRQIKVSAKAREIKTFYNSTEYVEGENGATKKYKLQNSPNKNEDGIQDLDSRSSTSAETPVNLDSQEEDEDCWRHGSRRPRECVTGYDDLKETTIGTSRLRKSYKLRRSKSDVNVSYRGRGRGEFWDPNDGHRSSPYKKHIPSEKRSPYLMKQDFRERMIEDEMDASPRSPVKARRKRRPGDGQVSSTLRRSLSDVDVSYRGNRKGHTSPRHRPTRRPIPVDNDPKDAIFKDAEAVETDDRRKHNRTRDHRRRFGMPSNLRRSMSDVDVSYHATNRAYNTSPTRHEQFLYNVPPVEYAEDCSEGKISDENLVILGSFKAGEDTGRKGKDGRTPTEPIGAGAKIVTGLVDSVKQSLGIPGEEVKEGETTYTDHLPDLIQGWATRQYTESKKNDDSGFMDNLKGRFNSFFGDDSKGRKQGEHVIHGSWVGGEDAGRQETVNDSGLIHSLKESLLSSARMDETKQHPGRKGGTTDPPGLLGSWAGGEDSGRKSTDEPGPLGFLGSLRRSFRMSSGEDPGPYGGEDEPVSPVFTGTFVSGETTGRNRKGGTSAPSSFRDYLPSFISTNDDSGKQRDDHSWFSPDQWWTGRKDNEANESPSWIQNLQNTMQNPWGDNKRDENAEKTRSVLDQWTGMGSARNAFDKWRNKAQNKGSDNSSSGGQKRGTRSEQEGSFLDYLGLNQVLNSQKPQGRHPCGMRGYSPRPKDKNSLFSFLS
ncbi:uncharacterized protein LOC118431071 isoform X2 [Branchiostoma floridae]|uniref:Uncharacterized protein LOC118431071 isoform X2 n=1 Tax=Branchiostoma floridae TaxID=7739 RepID=A0A9J7NBB7_BRAFL|nr:uncharacterized protein LOC118431071 isoform X2 [Branchiostoma floridae]